jgi:broad specificity phosphatase PhoE
MTKILLVRHGHVEGISPERFRGRANLPLTARGWRASEAAREWFAENRYQDYLYLHGLSVEMAEATPKRCSAIVVHHPQAKYFAV